MKKLPLVVAWMMLMANALCQGISKHEADSLLSALKKTTIAADRIDILLSLAEYQIHKPGENKIDFDSANTYINAAAALNKTLGSNDASGYQLLIQAFMTREKGQRAEAMKMVESAVNLLEKGKNKLYLGRAYYELSQFYDYNKGGEELAKMIDLVKKSIAAFTESGNVERKAFSLKMLGDLYNISGDKQKSIAALELAVESYASINYQQLQGVYAMLAETYKFENDYGQALMYGLKALKVAETFKDTSMQLCQINNILGSIYSNAGRDELSIQHYKEALKTAFAYNDSATVAVFLAKIPNKYYGMLQPGLALEFLASVPEGYKRSGNLQIRLYLAIGYFSAYMGAKEYSKAKPYGDLLLKMADDKVANIYDSYSIYALATNYFVFTGQLTKARSCLAKTDELIKAIRQPVVLLTYKMLQYKVDSLAGDYQSAFYKHFAFTKIKDSLFNVAKLRQLQLLEVEYGTAKKEDSIKLKNQDIVVLTQQNNLQQANLKRASLIRDITIAGIVVTIVIILLLYRLYRNRKKTSDVISNKNIQLQHLLTEKEWLLKEIHHRVKNNLQTVMSLLNSQSNYIENDAALTAIHDSQHRVQAMSLIHQKLYNTENVSSIDMSGYIKELVTYLRDSFDTGHRIRFDFHLEPLELDVSQAVPLGLILNEAITNSLKYAFPGGREGRITISLSKTGLRNYLLSISDDGIGIPEPAKNKKAGSLGMSLMAGLSEDLEGTFQVEHSAGTTIKISFVHDLAVKRRDLVNSSLIPS